MIDISINYKEVTMDMKVLYHIAYGIKVPVAVRLTEGEHIGVFNLITKKLEGEASPRIGRIQPIPYIPTGVFKGMMNVVYTNKWVFAARSEALKKLEKEKKQLKLDI